MGEEVPQIEDGHELHTSECNQILKHAPSSNPLAYNTHHHHNS